MNKKVVLGVMLCASVSSVALASPLDDYDMGRFSIDLGTSISPDMDVNGGSVDGKSRINGGVTAGLGNNWALQFRYADHKSDVFAGNDYNLKAQEYNALYRVNPNFSLFAGLVNARVERGHYDDSQKGFQVGLLGQMDFTDQLNGWASVAAGDTSKAYEIGLGYGLTETVDLNLFYRYAKYDEFDGAVDDVTAKGLNAGVTVRF